VIYPPHPPLITPLNMTIGTKYILMVKIVYDNINLLGKNLIVFLNIFYKTLKLYNRVLFFNQYFICFLDLQFSFSIVYQNIILFNNI